MSSRRSSARFRFTGAASLMAALLFLLPALRTGSPVLYLLAAAVPCAVLLSCTVLARLFSLDRMLMAVVLYLCAVGIAVPGQTDPGASLLQASRCGAGLFVLLAGSVLIRSLAPSFLSSASAAFLGLLMLAAKLLSPSLGFSLTEAALAVLLIAFASLFARQGGWAAALLGVLVLALLLARGETGFAALWGVTVLLLLFAADGRPAVVLTSLACVLLVFFVFLRFFPVREPAAALPSLTGYISAGAVGADELPEELASLAGVSLLPRLIGHFGLLFAGLTVLLFLPFSLRCAYIAGASRSRFRAVTAMGIALMFSLRTLVSALSVCGFSVFPDPGVCFLTSSLPDLCAQLFLVGILCGISGRNEADLAEDVHLAMLAK